MPIRPERRALYHPMWKEISEIVRFQADDRCEECRIPNGTVGYRWPTRGGEFRAVAMVDRPAVLRTLRDLRGPAARLTRIVLTVHHRDGDPENNGRENLAALCQRCHLRADRAMRMQPGTPAIMWCSAQFGVQSTRPVMGTDQEET